MFISFIIKVNTYIKDEYIIIRKRIQEKINMKPHWYKKTCYDNIENG